MGNVGIEPGNVTTLLFLFVGTLSLCFLFKRIGYYKKNLLNNWFMRKNSWIGAAQYINALCVIRVTYVLVVLYLCYYEVFTNVSRYIYCNKQICLLQ